MLVACMLFSKSFILAFTALLPLINPIGSALVFLGLVGDEASGGVPPFSQEDRGGDLWISHRH